MIANCDEMWHGVTKGITNHLTLLGQLRHYEKQGICLVAFNYDRLIEYALPTVGITIRKFDDYISNLQYKLIKLHGSVDWAHVIQSDVPNGLADYQTTEWIIQNASHLPVNYAEFEMVSKHPISRVKKPYNTYIPGGFQQDGQKWVGLFPAIAIPVISKNEFECPANHIATLERLIPEVDKLIVIGWRATEALFLRLLTTKLNPSHPIRALIVSDTHDHAKETANNLIQADILLENNCELFVPGFTYCVRTRQIETFLRS